MEIVKNQEEWLTLKEVCEELSISCATGRNWIKQKKILPDKIDGKTIYFQKNYVAQFKTEIQSGKNKALKSRRNKKFISGSALYQSYIAGTSVNLQTVQALVEQIQEQDFVCNEENVQLLLAEIAIQFFSTLFPQKNHTDSSYLEQYVKGEIVLSNYAVLVDDLITDRNAALVFAEKNRDLLKYAYVLEVSEDILGFVYLSCKNLGNRKATGSYYTPTMVVHKLVRELFLEQPICDKQKFLDPCCGTGNFLLQLPKKIALEDIYGNDIDEVSIKIARINLALKYQPNAIEILYQNFTVKDFLFTYDEKEFDYIFGNPPWGYVYTEKEKNFLRKNYACASGKNIESFDMFIEKALEHLKIGGKLSFVLPEALLTVNAHKVIREILMKNVSIEYTAYLGNAFAKVQCPCIVLQMRYTHQEMNKKGIKVNDGNREFVIRENRQIQSNQFCFTTTDEEEAVLEKLKNMDSAVTLENQAEFALGIVTGDNKQYISKIKSKENEMILKGADILKYRIKETENYIKFEPKQFQQVAPIKYYRAPEKLLYRFISNQLVFAYDNRQLLSLNSCNILIPKADGLEMKYVMAILNSRIAQFIFRKQFRSLKVLRSHIEKIPIPQISMEKQEYYIALVNQIMQAVALEDIQCLYDKLDSEIASLFQLSSQEYKMIKDSLEGENLFL